MHRCCIVYFASFWSLSVFGETYYVSGSGDNGNDGLTPATSFLSLQFGSDLVVAGDTVIVLPGSYTGFYHTANGTALQPIVFSAQPGVMINAPNGITGDGINLEGASYIVIEGFKVYGVPRAGIRSVLNTNVIIRNNNCDSCGMWGILTGWSEKILIENNECSRSVGEHGIYFSNSADSPVIRNNICRDNNANGIHMNGDAGLPGDGIISFALVENNIIFNNGSAGGSGINCDGVQDSRIQNNLLYNNHASGISLYRIDAGGGAINNVVVNNTILQPSDGRWALNIRDSSTGNTVFNNIFYSDHSFRGSVSIDAASLAGFQSNYNIVSDRMTYDEGTTVVTLAAWQLFTGQDNNSIISSPNLLFTTPGADDYHLLTTSPARDFGAALFGTFPAPLQDLENITRPQGPGHDAGAYEFPVSTMVKPMEADWHHIDAYASVAIYDLSGKLRYAGKKQSLDKRLPGGIYLFTAGTDRQKMLAGKLLLSGK